MRQLTTLISFFLLFNFSTSNAQEKNEVLDKKSYAPTQEENSLLWEISGKNLKTSSFLYGTIHMINKEDFFLTDATKEAFNKSEKITFEINMEEMNDFGVLFSLIGQVLMGDGTTLQDLLNEEDYTFIKSRFAELGLPLIMLERVKPMFLSTLAGGDMAPGDMESGKVVSYEMEFMQMAQEQEKEMDGLETIEYQMSVFDSIPYQDQADMLVESFRMETDTTGESAGQFEEMVKLYRDQDLVGMQNMFGEEDGIGEYEDVLLTNRNKNWIPIMQKQMAEKVTFFAVGAGHLGGENGVIALLRKEGYKVVPLR